MRAKCQQTIIGRLKRYYFWCRGFVVVAIIVFGVTTGMFTLLIVNYGFVENAYAAPKLYLSFNANGGSGAPETQSCTGSESCSIVIPSTIPTRVGYVFLGWATNPSAPTVLYQPNESIVVTAGGVGQVFAIWEESTGGLTYQSELDMSFTFNSSVGVSVAGGDLSIPNLAPGSYADSNEVAVTASSNAVAGYTLYATVGNSSNSSTELRKDGTSTISKFDSISSNIASLSNFSNNSNTWGYSYSPDSGATWQSGDYDNSPSLGYNGLPLYTATGVKLASANSSGTSSVKFKIGARASNLQTSGTYSNVVNFVAITKMVTLIDFNVGGTAFQAEEGMTWAEWIESGYNNVTWFSISGARVVRGGIEKIRTGQYNCVFATDPIISGFSYSASTEDCIED